MFLWQLARRSAHVSKQIIFDVEHISIEYIAFDFHFDLINYFLLQLFRHMKVRFLGLLLLLSEHVGSVVMEASLTVALPGGLLRWATVCVEMVVVVNVHRCLVEVLLSSSYS